MKFEDMNMDLPSPYLKELRSGEIKIHGQTFKREYTSQYKKTLFYEHSLRSEPRFPCHGQLKINGMLKASNLSFNIGLCTSER